MESTQLTQVQVLQYEAAKKSVAPAYVLWFFFGYLGGHRFYLKQGLGALMVLVTVLSVFTLFLGVGYVGIFAMFIWWVIDAFRIPTWVATKNLALIEAMQRASSPSAAA